MTEQYRKVTLDTIMENGPVDHRDPNKKFGIKNVELTKDDGSLIYAGDGIKAVLTVHRLQKQAQERGIDIETL